MIDKPHGNISLANIGFNIEGATAILNVGSFKTYTRTVMSHSGDTFTYEPVGPALFAQKYLNLKSPET